MSTTTIASWLLTYLIHSTVLLGVAWVVSRMLDEHRLALQEIFLRTALIGGILTASLQVGIDVEPLAGAFAIDVGRQPQAAVATFNSLIDLAPSTGYPNGTSASGFAMGGSAIESWAGALLILWGAGSLLALLTLGRSSLDLRRLLQTRRFRPAGRLVERLATAMGLGKRVLLSTSKAIAVPFATGIRKPEICCPERVCDLAIEHQTGLFAHELAHLARRDPTWQLLYRLGEAILFLQPLNRVVRRRLEEIAEHLTDERAVACTGDRLGLARCLVVIAHWGTSSRLGVPAAALASGPRLDRRVRRLLDNRTAMKVTPFWAGPLAVFLLAAAALTLPAVASVTSDAEYSADSFNRASSKTWSDAEDAPPVKPPVPDQPVSPDPAAPSPRSLSSPPEPAPAPLAVPAPGIARANDTPSTNPPTPAPADAPVPAEPAAPSGDSTPPSPATPPTSPRLPDEPNADSESDTAGERERARREAEHHRRTFERERAAAEERASQRMRQAEERTREFEERARRLAARAEERSRLVEERHEELRRQVDERRAAVEARGRELARTFEDRARVYAERAHELSARAAERAERSATQTDELRRQTREAYRKAMEDARRLSEEARKLAEEAERNALEEEPEKKE